MQYMPAGSGLMESGILVLSRTHTPDGGNLVPRFLRVFGQRVFAPLAEKPDGSGYEI